MEFKAKKVLKSAQKSPKILSKKSIHKPNVKVIQNSTKNNPKIIQKIFQAKVNSRIEHHILDDMFCQNDKNFEEFKIYPE